MKRIRRMTAALLSVLAVFLLLPLQALAAGSIDLNQDVSLTISYQDGNTPLVGAEFEIFLVATVDEYGELTTTKDFAQFHVNIRGKDDEAWRTLASTLEGYVLRDDISPTDCGKTNDKGLVSFPTAGKSLKAGLYFVLGYRHTPEILAGLGEMYVADERFRENIDKAGGEGTAAFVSRAIAVYCEK